MLRANKVSINKLEDTDFEYLYSVEVIVTFSNLEEQSIHCNGIIRMENNASDAKIVRFIPNDRVEDLIKHKE